MPSARHMRSQPVLRTPPRLLAPRLASPDIVALTPEQALEAYSASRSSAGFKRDGAGDDYKVDGKPVNEICWLASFNHDTPVDDTVALIAQLVGKGQQQVTLQPGSPEFGIDAYGGASRRCLLWSKRSQVLPWASCDIVSMDLFSFPFFLFLLLLFPLVPPETILQSIRRLPFGL